MSLTSIIREGQEKTLEQMALLEKQIAGTITPDESVRLNLLTGNLLALAKQAQSMGFGTQVNVLEEMSDSDDYDDDDVEYDDDYFCDCGDPECPNYLL